MAISDPNHFSLCSGALRPRPGIMDVFYLEVLLAAKVGSRPEGSSAPVWAFYILAEEPAQHEAKQMIMKNLHAPQQIGEASVLFTTPVTPAIIRWLQSRGAQQQLLVFGERQRQGAEDRRSDESQRPDFLI